MRLINCSTLQLEEFFGSNIPQYAILSHTWGDQEVSFADLPFDQSTEARAGFQKISFTCAQAIRDGLKYAWVDTCCIDKSSSSELSEAINSMFAWYKNSAHCYAYLSDVLEADLNESFSKSRWFTRGWTLQELLAPHDVIFYDQQWKVLGKRSEHAEWISEIAGIDAAALLQSTNTDAKDVGLGSFCVAKKMSWASHRVTTRLEDIAYCLLGIFDVNMPLLYGEGDRAFLRLQEEIIRRSDDDSILAWGLEPAMNHPRGLIPEKVWDEMTEWYISEDLLASSPKDFRNCASLKYTSGSVSPFTMTNAGLQVQLQLVPVTRSADPDGPSYPPLDDGGWVGLLSCASGRSLEFMGVPLVPDDDGTGSIVQKVPRIRIPRGKNGEKLSPTATIVVGPRAAVKSITRTVIISRYGRDDITLENFFRGHLQIIVDASRSLQEMGFRIKSGTESDIWPRNRVADGHDSVWDSETQILTMERRSGSSAMVEFRFESPWTEPNSTFTVFMHTYYRRTTVRKGGMFSKVHTIGVCQYLENKTTQDDTDSIVIPDSKGGEFKITARAHGNKVYRHTISEVSVEAVLVRSSTD
ncbi:heterokaryon incompatibility protein-domain-containing protein [Paraphoma chrysanthemicola]|uniref:Heterokaryon incompatibility protein-domain-containing protein n=1 Tax=Paraphoma chrysanthemicola TaxID=798071 RepID=A0A8K0QTF5_9PLEO|nr:heterokaryon incompatibility protein-domain-containing protein [Paraphoma chrysanthemicola]